MMDLRAKMQADPPEHGLLAASTASAPRNQETCPASGGHVPRQARGRPRSFWSNSFLPGIYQGTHIKQFQPSTPKDRVAAHSQQHVLPRAAQREAKMDLLKKFNRNALATARAGSDNPLEARIASLGNGFSGCSSRRKGRLRS